LTVCLPSTMLPDVPWGGPAAESKGVSLGRRWLALLLVALAVSFTAEAFAAKPTPPPTIVATVGYLAIASDGTVYELNVANATCGVSLASAVVYGQFFTTPPVSPITSAWDAGIGIMATLANGDIWVLNVSCCTPCYRKGTYIGNIFTVAGAAASAPADMIRLDGGLDGYAASSLASSPDRIEYETPRSGAVEVEVFDVQGRLVWNTRSEHGTAGRYSVSWGGKDRAGQSVAAGVYFSRMQLPDGTVMSDRIVVAR
jgi:hypothetical protein